MNLVETLQSLEPIFVEAGKLALKMQKGVDYHNKYSTGNPLADIVGSRFGSSRIFTKRNHQNRIS